MLQLSKEKKEMESIDYKIDECLLRARRIFLSGVVDGTSARDVIRKLWYLELENPAMPILLVINSPGGSVDDGFAIWDQIKLITSPITTLVTGLAASMGSLLSLAAPAHKRFVTPYARIMIHQPGVGGWITGQATDLQIHASEIEKLRHRTVEIYMEATGQERAVIQKAIDRDRWFSAQEAIEFGLVGKVISSFDDI